MSTKPLSSTRIPLSPQHPQRPKPHPSNLFQSCTSEFKQPTSSTSDPILPILVQSTHHPRNLSPISQAKPRALLSTGSWALYDFSDTIFSASILTFYFPLWVTDDKGGTGTRLPATNHLSMATPNNFSISPHGV